MYTFDICARPSCSWVDEDQVDAFRYAMYCLLAGLEDRDRILFDAQNLMRTKGA